MRSTVVFASTLLAIAATSFSADEVSAQDGIALNRFDPSDRGSDWFSTDSLDLRGSGRFSVGVVGDWSHKPLVLYDKTSGDEIKVLVGNQLFAHVGASLTMWDRLRFAVNLPIAAVNSGDKGSASGYALSDGFGIGDIRVGADVRLLGTYGGVFSAALGAQVHIPTGKASAFLGDGKARIVPRALIAGDIGIFAYSARLGINVHTMTENFDNQPFGTDFSFAAAAGVRLVDGRLLIGPEVFGQTVISDWDTPNDVTATPFEIIGGGHFKITDSWRIGAGVGPGLSRGFGAPQIRALLSVEWTSPVEKALSPSDRDGDGILDDDDACPDVPGPPNKDPKKHGCPPPPDRDGDGIIDSEDACPDEPGPPNDDRSKHGCPPPPDRDGDGIIDSEDACPDDPGPPNKDLKKHGCPPPPDRDGDGIIDSEDACPDDAGPPNSDPSKNGCPKAIKVKGEIRIMEQVQFDTRKSTIRSESHALLNEVKDILAKNPDITKVRVEGHTDNRGGAAYNLKLSKARAKSVMDWLTRNGIAPERLESEGYGQTVPIDTNSTDTGRQNNRRVQFKILEQKAE